MSRVKLRTVLLGLITVCAGCAYAGTTTAPPAPRKVHRAHKPVSSQHVRPIKRTWQSGPASLAPETEVIPARPPASPPRAAALHMPPAKVNVLASGKQRPTTRPVHATAPVAAASV